MIEFGIVLNGLLRCSISNVAFQQGDMLGIHGYLGRPTEISPFGVEGDVTFVAYNGMCPNSERGAKKLANEKTSDSIRS